MKAPFLAEARAIFERDYARRNRRRPPPAGTVVVEPNRPLDLSGGAAAALEFDD